MVSKVPLSLEKVTVARLGASCNSSPLSAQLKRGKLPATDKPLALSRSLGSWSEGRMIINDH